MRITELPQATSVAQTDDFAIDVPGGRTYKVPRSVLAPAPYVATIPTGQWSGSGSDRYITISASNVTADAMLYPFYDNASGSLLKGPVWVIPADGSFTIHTTAIPAGTVTISVLFAGILGEAQYQVLADVYSKAQTDALVAQSTASAETTLSGQLSANVTGWADYIKFGKIVVVQFVLSNTAELSAGTSIVTGLPKPDRLYTVGDYKFFNMSSYFRVGDNGSIVTGNVIAANTTIRGSACYISA